jgi:hypothetical protein
MPQTRKLPHERPNAWFFGIRVLRRSSYGHGILVTNLLLLSLTRYKRLLAGNGVSPAAVTLLSNGELDTLALGEGDPGLLLSDDADKLLVPLSQSLVSSATYITLDSRVVNSLSTASFRWTMLKPPS